MTDQSFVEELRLAEIRFLKAQLLNLTVVLESMEKRQLTEEK
jgi:hypothetical protein